MTPTIGRIVHYRITKEEANKMNARREEGLLNAEKMRRTRPGFQAHIGNFIEAGDIVPMIIVRVWTDSVNGHALLDGNDSLWVLTVKEGVDPGEWSWPPKM